MDHAMQISRRHSTVTWRSEDITAKTLTLDANAIESNPIHAPEFDRVLLFWQFSFRVGFKLIQCGFGIFCTFPFSWGCLWKDESHETWNLLLVMHKNCNSQKYFWPRNYLPLWTFLLLMCRLETIRLFTQFLPDQNKFVATELGQESGNIDGGGLYTSWERIHAFPAFTRPQYTIIIRGRRLWSLTIGTFTRVMHRSRKVLNIRVRYTMTSRASDSPFHVSRLRAKLVL